MTHIFEPTRIVGQVSTGIPFATEYEANCSRMGLIYVPVENTVSVYSMRPIKLRHSTTPTQEKISLVVVYKHRLYAVAGDELMVYEQKKFCTQTHKLAGEALAVMPIGETVVIVYKNGEVTSHELETFQVLNTFTNPPSFIPTTALHPHTYVNKVLLTSQTGKLRLINYKKGLLVHEFQETKLSMDSITASCQSPAVDVIAFGFSTGLITLRNIKLDLNLMSFMQDGQITGITFRSDGVDSMITSSDEGSLAVWDLNEKCLVGMKTKAHEGRIVKIECVKGQPFLLSSGEDNKFVKWSFEQDQSLPEAHTIVEGHAKEMTYVKYIDNRVIVSASRDGTLRKNSAKGPMFFKRLGRGEQSKKKYVGGNSYKQTFLNPIVEISGNVAREHAWDNIVCRHEDSPLISCWSTSKDTQGKIILFGEQFFKDPKFSAIVATAVSMSSCGNFAYVGYSTGHVYCFNIQSGLFRFALVDSCLGEKEICVNGSVIAVCSDIGNSRIVVVSQNGHMAFFDREQHAKLVKRMSSQMNVVAVCLNQTNNLLAVASQNGDLALIDTVNFKVGRKFTGAHKNTIITAMTQSPDGKWLVSCDREKKIKVWDLVVSELLDVILMPEVVIGVAFSEDGAFLSTILEGKSYVYVWSNRSFYDDNFAPKAIRDYGFTPTETTSLPQFELMGDETLDAPITDTSIELMETFDISTLAIRGDNLLTLSELPETRWANLPYLDDIKERNKPTAAITKPKNAPFFLPTIQTMNGFEFAKIEDNSGEREIAVAKKRQNLELMTSFAAQLVECDGGELFEKTFNELKEMTVSSIEYQLKTLPYSALSKFFQMMTLQLKTKHQFELVEYYVATVMKNHRSQLWSNEEAEDDKEVRELTEAIDEYSRVSKDVFLQLNGIAPKVSSMLRWIKNSTL
uniref:Utp21 domain-containing protein n=1 Tax=Rhabditophanes sp. KR3021 TaxID=114890 RepID=A0AC35UGH9_9BILA